MMTGWLALAIALAGCGRLGFQEIAGHSGDDAGGVTSDTITVVVTGDESSTDPAGMPIEGATVIVERSAGVDRKVTDATGSAAFPAAGVLACHVAFATAQGWRVYTMVAPPGGRIELGGRPSLDPSRDHAMKFTVPDNGSGDFWLHFPEHCGYSPKYGSATFTQGYDPACEGKAAHVIAYTRPTGTTQDRYLDAGSVTFAQGSTRTVTGSYLALPAHTVQVTNLPGLVNSADALIYERADLDLTQLSADFGGATPQGGTATVSTAAAPGGNTLRVSALANLPIQYSSISELMEPAVLAAQMTIDARMMVPVFQSLVLTSPPSVAWTGGEGRGTILAVEITAGSLQWDAYLPPSATSVTFPELPAALGVPIPSSYDFASVARLEVPGATAADLAPTIDRTWSSWPHDRTLFPPGGGGEARIVYSIGLGPP